MCLVPARHWIPALACALLAATTLPLARDLTFDERVAAQEAIERVYYTHQRDARLPFEEAVPRDVLERKVRTYLKQSVVLAERWGTTVTAELLRAEWRRIARGSRFPRRLEQVYDTLGRDPLIIQECFVRPILVDRLARNFHAFDRRLHGASRDAIDSIRERLLRGWQDPGAPDPHRTVLELRRAEPGGLPPERPRPGEPEVLSLDPEAFARRRAAAPHPVGYVGDVAEDRSGFTVQVVLDEEPGRVRIARYRVPKTPWDSWWSQVQGALDEGSVRAAASRDPALPSTLAKAGDFRPEDASTLPCAPDDTWDNGVLDQVLEDRSQHTMVWTGTHVIVWGGYSSSGGYRHTGGLYDPLTDTWEFTSTLGAPSERRYHTAVWTGSEMIVWGGRSSTVLGDGGRYDPVTDTWTPVSLTGAPDPKYRHVAVWTGSEMIVWGGDFSDQDTGGLYDPSTDSWQPTSLVNAPAGRADHTAVWTGSEMIVWGGYGGSEYLDSGGRYDPATDTWSATSQVGAPSPRIRSSLVWTGTRLIVWGGYGGSEYLDSGGRYDPATDTWSTMTTTAAPAARQRHTSVWTGFEMIVWGGSPTTDTGGRYDPATDQWTPTSTLNAPAPRSGHQAVWTGSLMVVWGPDTSGGRYDPATDSWTPTATENVPRARSGHSAVWTGSVMIIWGGGRDSGGRYDPMADSWTPTSTSGVPMGDGKNSAVWSGNHMIVWGGDEGSGYETGTGGLYDPIADTWTPTSTSGAPASRWGHRAVWADDQMIVWGGYPSLDTGGRYDPATDAWLPISTLGAPDGRYDQTAVWTGTHMLVWGGENRFTYEYFRSGGLYDPITDTWTPTTVVGAPSGRVDHTAVWTGTHMLVWGGYPPWMSDGGAFDPVANSWSPISTMGAPAPRGSHTAIWTGDRMVIWGGFGGAGPAKLSDGGVYDPATDSWSPTASVGAPRPRVGHSAVWDGAYMLIWGGRGDDGAWPDGGRYALGHFADRDQDGFTLCDGDCDDGAAEFFPGAPELCDGLDNDCDGSVPPEEGDGDGDGFLACADCDDSDGSRFPGNVEVCDEVDNDCDGIFEGHPTSCGVGACASTGICTAGSDSCVPGAPVPESCDGLDNDCDGDLPAGELDGDGDGWIPCAGDCADNDAWTYPGAPEVNDRRDNQCPGEPGAGLADEVEALEFPDGGDPGTLTWTAQPFAASYEVSRSGEPGLAGSCTRFRTATTTWTDPDVPPEGEVTYYLVQAVTPHSGSFGVTSGPERSGVCGAENDCKDGIDNDLDGRADCDDPSCLGKDKCDRIRIYFHETAGDDVPTEWLQDFFAQLSPQPTDHLYLGLNGGGLNLTLCLERADFYRDSYLALAPGGGSALSGGWSKWYRETSGWIGPVTGSFENWYGSLCAEPYSWCAEFGLGGHVAGIAPWEVGVCESFDEIACGDGTLVDLVVGLDRATTCSF